MTYAWVFSLLIWASSPSPEVIENGRSPEGKPVTLTLTEDLRIGPEDGDDEFLWTGPNASVQANQAGHMFVMDDGGSRILEFSPDGSLVRQIGRPGKGPGEFDGLRSFRLLKNGGAMSFEFLLSAGTINYYDKNLKFQREVNLARHNTSLDTATLSHDGRWLFGTNNGFDSSRRMVVFRYFLMNDKFEMVNEVLRYERSPFDGQRVADPAYWKEYMAEAISTYAKGDNAFGAFSSDGLMYTAVASRYEVTVWDKNGKKLRTFKRDYKPITQTEDEVAAIVDPVFEEIQSQLPGQVRHLFTPGLVQGAVELANFPPVKNPIFGVSVADNGTVLVIHDRDLVSQTETADLFSPEGRYLGSYTHPSLALTKMFFLNGNGYTLEVEDDEKYLVRYKIQVN